ncbi:MAG: pilus assembly protein [Selenomonadaceae bacterium]|nr:pilus assembly protein [Selenomonadaceae bacterium]
MNNRQRGQATVEFALVIPILIYLFVSIIYIGIAFMDYIQYSNAARDAARDISLQAGTTSDAAALRKSLASSINAQNSEVLDRYAVQLTSLYTPTWTATFMDSDGDEVSAEKASDIQISIALKREEMPPALESLNVLPKELKTINYKMRLETSTIIYKSN